MERETHFARAERAGPKELAALVRLAAEEPLVKIVLEAVQGFVLILNELRQILAANQELLDALNREGPETLIGWRPGEALNCLHFTEGPGGCGTAKHCRTCGAVLSILASQDTGAPATDECRLSMERDGKLEAVDYQVRSTPLRVGEHNLIVFVLHDISAGKRREVLEQVFLHDILNVVSGISGWSEVLQRQDPTGAAREVVALAERLKEAVQFHRLLLKAEQGELTVDAVPIGAGELLGELRVIFRASRVTEGKSLDWAPAPENARFCTGRGLLMRVLVNMVNNALEATESGGTVRVSFEWRDRRAGFVVQNASVIPADVAPHIFERSFSTKSEQGRGLGTYSMKLFGERYLGGAVSFTSDEANGTQFAFLLPPEAGLSPEAPCDTLGAGAAARDAAERASGETVPQGTPAEADSPQHLHHVLLVDDDEPILRWGRILLERMGHTATTFRDPGDALAAFQSAPEAFSFVIGDFAMPKMNGVELCRLLHRIRPEIPFLLCTGFYDAVTEQQAKEVGIGGILLKPFTRAMLAERIRGMSPKPGS